MIFFALNVSLPEVADFQQNHFIAIIFLVKTTFYCIIVIMVGMDLLPVIDVKVMGHGQFCLIFGITGSLIQNLYYSQINYRQKIKDTTKQYT